MRRLNNLQPVGVLIVTLAILFGSIGNISAATSSTASGPGNGMSISPVRTDVTINPGKSQTVVINVTNVTTAPATLQAIINDFTANKDETGNPAVILDPTQYASSHSLKRFIAPIPDFTLGAGQKKSVPVVINVPNNAPGGGYFGAVRFAPAGTVKGANQNVSLAGSVGSLIIAKVTGDIKDQLSIASFNASQQDHVRTVFTSSKNIDAIVRFENTGNVQEQPYGKILLKNRSGKVLSQTEVNNLNPPSNVLPDSIRKFTVPIKNMGGFGKYKLEGNFGYGSGGQLLSASTTFYVVPIGMIYGTIFAVLLLLFLIFGLPRLVRRYNQNVVRKAGRR